MPKTKNKPFKPSTIPIAVMIILAILTVAFVLVSGIYLWYFTKIVEPVQQLAQGQQALQEQITDIQTKEVATEEVVVELKEPKTQILADTGVLSKYVSKGKDFEFQYPKGWVISSEMEGSWILTNFGVIVLGYGGLPEEGIKMDFSIENNLGSKKLDEIQKCEVHVTEELLECTKVTINGVAYKKLLTEGDFGPIVLYVAATKDKIYKVWGYVGLGTGQEQRLSKIDEISKTFIIK